MVEYQKSTSTEVKNVIVFGATGQTGLKILKRALDEGLQVTAFVRNPEKIPSEIRAELYAIVQGDIFDKQKVENVIKGQGAVLSALGDGASIAGKGTVSQGCANIVAGMNKHGVKKLVTVGTAGWLPDQSGLLTFVARKLGVVKDHAKHIAILEGDKNIDWSIVMAPFIKNSPTISPHYQVQRDALPGVNSVTTAEIADFMVSFVVDKEKTERYRHCKLGISSGPTSPSSGRYCKYGIAVLVIAVGVWYYGKYNKTFFK